MARVKFARGTQAAYDGIQNKDADTLYFCTNTGNLYLGSTLIFEPNAIISAALATGGTKGITFTRRTGATETTPFTVSLSDYVTSTELSNAIHNAVSGLYNYKGSTRYADLPTTDVKTGDVWNVIDEFTISSGNYAGTYPAGTNVAAVVTRVGETVTINWDPLGGVQDFSNFVQKPESFTERNIMVFDANGNAHDSGYDPTDFKPKQTAVSDPLAASGQSSVEFISNISQDANGVISPTKKAVRDASASQSGLMSAAHYTKLEGLPADAEKNVVVGAQAVNTPAQGNATTVEIPIDSTSRKLQIQTKSTYNGSSNKFVLENDVASAIDSALGWITLAEQS